MKRVVLSVLLVLLVCIVGALAIWTRVESGRRYKDLPWHLVDVETEFRDWSGEFTSLSVDLDLSCPTGRFCLTEGAYICPFSAVIGNEGFYFGLISNWPDGSLPEPNQDVVVFSKFGTQDPQYCRLAPAASVKQFAAQVEGEVLTAFLPVELCDGRYSFRLSLGEVARHQQKEGRWLTLHVREPLGKGEKQVAALFCFGAECRLSKSRITSFFELSGLPQARPQINSGIIRIGNWLVDDVPIQLNRVSSFYENNVPRTAKCEKFLLPDTVELEIGCPPFERLLRFRQLFPMIADYDYREQTEESFQKFSQKLPSGTIIYPDSKMPTGRKIILRSECRVTPKADGFYELIIFKEDAEEWNGNDFLGASEEGTIHRFQTATIQRPGTRAFELLSLKK